MDAEALASVPFFADLSLEARRAVAPHAQRITVAEGAELTVQGRPGYLFFVVESGRAAVFQDDRELGELDDGDFFGEIALLETGERTASVVARTPVRLIVVTDEGFKRLLATDRAAALACEAALRERWAAPA